MTRTVGQLLPLGIFVAVIGIAIVVLISAGWTLGPWLLAFFLIGHGWVHLMFAFPRPQPKPTATPGLEWPFDMGSSWLILRVGLEPALVRAIGVVLMGVTFVGFTLAGLATVGLVVPEDWWAGLVTGSAVASIALLTAFFSPTLLIGYAIDVVLIWLAAVTTWSPPSTPL